MVMNRIRRVVAYTFAAVALTAGAATAATGTADANDDKSSSKGCPSGAVCLYGDGDWANGTPEHVYWRYGAHEVHNEYGYHRLFNWQTGDAGAQVCRAANGTDCLQRLGPGWNMVFDMDRINSINLTR